MGSKMETQQSNQGLVVQNEQGALMEPNLAAKAYNVYHVAFCSYTVVCKGFNG